MAQVDEIRLVLEAKAAALVARQASDLAALIHSEFTYVNARGRIFDKATYIETYCVSGKGVFIQQRFADLSVKVIDAAAIAIFAINDELRIDKRMVSGRYQSLCVFSKFSGRWLWAAGQTMVAEPA